MKPNFHFTFESDWRKAPLAFWVHVPVPGTAKECTPPSPEAIPHQGYLFLHVEFETYDLQFSALAQLDHFIDVMVSKPLPTSRQLSLRRGVPVGPNSHWLSRLPSTLKSPRKREKLIQLLRTVRTQIISNEALEAFLQTASR
jgi:hypothetical protein